MRGAGVAAGIRGLSVYIRDLQTLYQGYRR